MSQMGKRLAFNNARNSLKRAGVSPARAVLSQSYLRFECLTSTSQTQYTFDTLVNENINPNFSTQKKLDLQDAFYISDLSFFIGLAASSSTNESIVRLFSYASAAATSASLSLGVTPVAAQANVLPYYNGFLSLTVNQRIILPSWDLYRHYVVPQTQQITANTVVGNQDQINIGTDASYTVEPNLVLIGSKKNVLQIVIPAAPAAIIANTRLVIIARGILAQNASSIQ